MRGARGRFLIAACLLFGALVSAEINEGNLKERLSPSEWLHLMGEPGEPNDDVEYAITHPVHEPPKDVKAPSDRSDGGLIHRLELQAPLFGRNFSLKLTRSPNLLAENFVFIETFKNDSHVIPHHTEDEGCYYKSEIAALNLCGGARGLVHSDNRNYFIIHPLPSRFHVGATKPHLLVRKSFRNINKNVKNLHFRKPNGDKHAKKRKKVLPASPPAKSKYYGSDATTSLDNKKRSANVAVKMPVFLTKDSLITKGEKGDIPDGLSSPDKTKRRKRDTFAVESPVFVETAVFVDRDLFDHMKTNFPTDTERELIRFVLAMINAVQLLYHDSSLGRPVNFLLKRLEILKEESSTLSRSPDIDRYLSSFCNWQRTKNPVGDREPQHWDHALILTGLDLYVRGKHGKISSQVVGLAPVAGMCTSTSSCTVNEGRHFESVYVVAHEIGHNLGMRHDGPLADNDCDPSSYIMSPTLGSGKITWSSCSRRYLQKFLDTPQSRCLLDHGSSAGQLDHSAEGALPGERFDANQQCMLKYGRGSKHSSQQPLDDVCRDLHCERERYTWTSHPALEGTLCGHNMWCKGGRCISKGLGVSAAYSSSQLSSARLDNIDGGWSNWRSFSDCASGCLYGEEGRLRTGSTGIMEATRLCNNPRPQGGGSECEGHDKKYQACNAQQCLNVPRLTVREFSGQICNRAKEVDKELTGSGSQKISSDPGEACLVWCQKRNGGTKSRGWTFPDGTACQTRRNKYSRQSYCINGKCEDFVCDLYDEEQFVQHPELCPVDREDNEITWRTDVRRRDIGVHWASASGCHFNCISPGSGIRLVVNKAKNVRSSIQLCQPDQYGCGRIKSPFQHASMVCTKYRERVRRLSGLGMQISPVVEDPDRPCRVACQDENISHRFYLVNGEDGWFPFGTDCSRGMASKKSYCISGKCLEFGPDDTPVSQSEFTLPLLSRTKRSLHNNSTKVTATLHQQDLDEIISKFNETIEGQNLQRSHDFKVDLSNPIHINMESENMPLFNVNKAQEEDYYNYA